MMIEQTTTTGTRSWELTYTFYCKHWGQEQSGNGSWLWSLKPVPSDKTYFLLQGHSSYTYFPTGSPTGDQVFKGMRLWQTPHSNHIKASLRVLILLFPPPKCWGSRHLPPGLATNTVSMVYRVNSRTTRAISQRNRLRVKFLSLPQDLGTPLLQLPDYRLWRSKCKFPLSSSTLTSVPSLYVLAGFHMAGRHHPEISCRLQIAPKVIYTTPAPSSPAKPESLIDFMKTDMNQFSQHDCSLSLLLGQPTRCFWWYPNFSRK